MAKGVVVVTGGSRGIGAEIAVESARAGNDVVIGYTDPKKEKRAAEVISRVEALGMSAVAFRGDLTADGAAYELLEAASEFAEENNKRVTTLVLNAAGGLEGDATTESAYAINSLTPQLLASAFILGHAGEFSVHEKDVVFVTSNPSHFYGHPANVMPSESYDIVAASKHDGEARLRTDFKDYSPDMLARLFVATADLVDNTAGAMLLRLAHRRATADRTADLLAERSEQLRPLIGRGITDATEFGGAIVSMFSNDELPSQHTLYLPQPVLGEHIVTPSELPFGIGANQALYTFVK